MILEYLAGLILWFRSLSLIPQPYDLLIASMLFLVVIPLFLGFTVNIMLSRLVTHRCRHREVMVTTSFMPSNMVLFTGICLDCRGTVFRQRPADLETVRTLARSDGYISLVHVPYLYRFILEQIASLGITPAKSQVAELEEVLKELDVKLLLRPEARVEVAHFRINRRTRRLYVKYPSYIVPYLMDVKVVEVLRNTHANRIICLFQLVGRLSPYGYVLDNVVVGEDSSGIWMARPPPELWSKSIEEQLKWIANLPDRVWYLVES